MQTVVLDSEEYDGTFVAPMRDVTDSVDTVVDIWSYVLAIPRADLAGLSLRVGVVDYVYRSGDDRFDHVLVPASAKNVYVVVIVTPTEGTIRGHHLLDLNEKYGINVSTTVDVSPLALEVCSKQSVIPVPSEPSAILGIALATLDLDPLNGLRSHLEGGTCGWYVWGGEDLPMDNEAFFQPLHVSHLSKQCPSVLPYLALPPGWRFLLGANGFVDVWYDERLLTARPLTDL